MTSNESDRRTTQQPAQQAPLGQHAEAAPLAQVTKDAVAKIAADDEQRRSDHRVFWRRFIITVAVAAIGAGAIEYAGLQIAFRHGARTLPPDLYAMKWLAGTAMNFVFAKGVGLVAMLGVLPFAKRLKRPLLNASAAFAIGTGAVLAFLSVLTALAP